MRRHRGPRAQGARAQERVRRARWQPCRSSWCRSNAPIWSGEATGVFARTVDGELGILPHHAPLLGALEPGRIVRIEREGEDDLRVAVHGGFLSVGKDGVSVLAEMAETADEIDVARARAALDKADADSSGGRCREGSRAGSVTRSRRIGLSTTLANRQPCTSSTSSWCVRLLSYWWRARSSSPGSGSCCARRGRSRLRCCPVPTARWQYGVARFAGGELRWYRSLGVGTRPNRVLRRREVTVLGRRPPLQSEQQSLPSTAVVVQCRDGNADLSARARRERLHRLRVVAGVVRPDAAAPERFARQLRPLYRLGAAPDSRPRRVRTPSRVAPRVSTLPAPHSVPTRGKADPARDAAGPPSGCIRFAPRYGCYIGSRGPYSDRGGCNATRSLAPRIHAAGAAQRAHAGQSALDDHPEHGDEAEGDHRDQRLHHRPGLERLPDGEPEALVDQPEAGVVDVRQEQRPGADRQREQGQVGGRLAVRQRGDRGRRPSWWRRSPSRWRAGSPPPAGRRSPAPTRRSCWPPCRSSRRPRADQRLLEPAAGTDDQDDAGDRRQRRADAVGDRLAVEADRVAEGDRGEHDGEEQRDQRLADEVDDDAAPGWSGRCPR